MNMPMIGQSPERVEGHGKVTGTARYAAEFNQPGQVYAIIVGSTVGLGRVVRIESALVMQMPGVLAVISHQNAPRLPYVVHKGPIDPAVGERLHVLQDDEVRFYGQPVAVVVADTLDNAERAAAALQIAYASERPVVDAQDPKSEPVVPEAATHPASRVQADKTRGDADSVFSAAPIKVDAIYDMPRENHHPMEPHATVAAWNGDHLTLWSKSQFVVRAGGDCRHLRNAGRKGASNLPVHRRGLRNKP